MQPPVAAGLEDVGGHGDRAEAAGQRVRHVERIHPGGEGDVQLPVEFLLQPFGEVDADGMQGSAAHVHHAFAAGQVLLFVGGFERVGQLEPEGHARRFGGCGEVADDGCAVVVFEVVPEGFVGNAYVIAELRIQDVAQAFGAEQGGVQLYGRVIPAFGDEIAADALHFAGRTAVHGGDRQIVGEAARNGHLLDGGVERGQLGLDPLHVFFRVFHTVEETLHGGALDAFKVVARAHVEDEAGPFAGFRLCGQVEHVAQHIQQHESLEVLLKGLSKLQLLRPFAVVALVGHVDAGLGDVQLVEHLHGLEFDIPSAAQPRGQDVLGKLRMRAGGHAERGFQHLAVALHAERIIRLRHKEKLPADAEQLFVRQVVLHPAEQRCGIQRCEAIGMHVCVSLKLRGNWRGWASGKKGFSRAALTCVRRGHFIWPCQSMWLFHLHSAVKIQPFSPVFPLAESIAKAFCRLFLWNFKEKSINPFLWCSLLF